MALNHDCLRALLPAAAGKPFIGLDWRSHNRQKTLQRSAVILTQVGPEGVALCASSDSTNVLTLLQSPADSCHVDWNDARHACTWASDAVRMSGLELVTRKVRELVWMGGNLGTVLLLLLSQICVTRWNLRGPTGCVCLNVMVVCL